VGPDEAAGSEAAAGPEEPSSLFSASAPPSRRRRTRKTTADTVDPGLEQPERPDAPDGTDDADAAGTTAVGSVPLFKAPDPDAVPSRPSARRAPPTERSEQDATTTENEAGPSSAAGQTSQDDDSDDESGARRRRRRGGRRRRKSGAGDTEAAQSGGEVDASGSRSPAEESAVTRTDTPGDQEQGEGGQSARSDEKQTGAGESAGGDGESTSGSTRRRRRRRRKGEPEAPSDDDPENTVVRVRDRRPASDEITSVEGSTRLEAKKQRRREGREAGRKRVPILSESEFLARRESVTREMVVRQRGEVTQIAVLEDNVLVEHYVARESQTSLMGNVYLGRVQNVLPSMEAAFVDIGKGRNAVLYAGEVDWKALGFEGKPRKIEDALSSGQSVLVQVSKDPVDHKGARLTGQVSLPGRFLVYVPRGHSNGISRKLPESERSRLKGLLKDILPEHAGVIVRTAAEGATEEQLSRDVSGLTARWEDIEKKSKTGQGPKLLYGEPDLLLKVVRDLFNEDFTALTVQGDDAWDNIEAYVKHVAPDLGDRLKRYEGDDVFSNYRVDEQIAKALDRKVFLPSGGSLVIDRTEAMTVVDVNTGKFTGSGGNLEETVTRNNLEAAEEVVRQLRLRDIGGIIVVDFIDMVLELNRDLVLRRLVECLSRDRTRHQVAEVTSLGLVQMTRKKIGTGLLEAFGETCEQCGGRGVLMHTDPIDPAKSGDDGGRKGSRRRGGGKAQAAKTEDTPDDKGTGDPATAPVTEAVGAEPATEPVDEAATESATEPDAESAGEPVTGSASDSGERPQT
jgi:ribonuclease E